MKRHRVNEDSGQLKRHLRQEGGGGLSEAQLLEMMRLVADDAKSAGGDAGDEAH